MRRGCGMAEAEALTRTFPGHGETMWPELWNELHHEGDVGTASYASVPHLLRIYRTRRAIDWNIYAMVATIELARDQRQNTELPKLLEKGYFRAFYPVSRHRSFRSRTRRRPRKCPSDTWSDCISKGLRVHARFLVEFSEDELLEVDPFS